MATAPLQTSLVAALEVPFSGKECTMELSNDIAVGVVSIGGYVASIMTKFSVLYASEHPKMRSQTDVCCAVAQFYRPVLPAKPITMQLREVSVGNAWSTLRVELLQGGKLAASADVIICDFALPGISLETKWTLLPKPRRVDLLKLEMDGDPDWVSYHPAFHPDGFRRGHSYARTFIPKDHPVDVATTEQWICPGWDCLPLGSCTARRAEDKARWTTDMIQLIIDETLPVHHNLLPQEAGKPPFMGSISGALEYAALQKKARDEGKADWRPLPHDGSKKIILQPVHATLSMSTEIKRKLPSEGVRWLYARSTTKSIVNGRLDIQVLLFNEKMDLIAISNQVNQIIPSTKKNKKTGKKEMAQL
ncbi:hypothetical protein QQS21_001999 [Conoideocrella luteorostrata]|uniref:Uncharacterized protein n=1 Tax=Conoideocrella luteorostrata TaxID=1105319 RepID=A0AAJ0CYM8_9HYPO|nr:hypothetical protein QQS21_001999 [Conoideocrella luteorostrata]